MLQEISLEDVIKEVEAWRKIKKHYSEKLPDEIAKNIKELAKHHERSHIAAALKISGGTLNRALGRTAIFKERKKTYHKRDWLPVKIKEEREIAGDAVTLELSLANQTTIRIRIAKSEAIHFLQEMCHAATVVR